MEEIKGELREPISNKEIEKRIKKLSGFFFGWVKDNYDKAFIAVLVLSVLIRIYFLSISIHQPVWWDSADYLTEAKVLAGNLNIPYYFTPRRTFLLPLLWAGLLNLGFEEISFRILELIFSIAVVPATYLIGKQLFDKKIALIASFLSSVFWMYLFYSNKLMTEIPTLALFLFSVYFFWQGYTKKNEKMFIWFGIFLGLAFLARAGTIVMFAIFPIFLLITEKLKFIKRKYLWFGVLAVLAIMAFFFIFTSIKQDVNAISYFLALTPETSGGNPRFSNLLGFQGISEYFSLMPHYFGWVLLSIFGISVIIFLFELFLSFDMIIKRKDTSRDKYLFLFLLAFVPFIFQAMFYHHTEDRYLMNAFPAFFLILSIGLVKIAEKLKKYKKYLGLFFILLILAVGAFQQITQANAIIESKINSYQEVKDSAIWIKENSNTTAIVFSASVPQTTYYAERETYNFLTEDINQSYFEQKMYDLKPTFLVLSVFEPHSQWIYTYPEKHPNLLIPVKAYNQNDQPVLIVYQFNYAAMSDLISNETK